MSLNLINIAAITQNPVIQTPFPHLIIDQIFYSEKVDAIALSFPAIQDGGSIPLSQNHYSPLFNQLIQELESDDLREVIARQFKIDLTDRPCMTTLRGYSRAKDGRIHTDSKDKKMTLLVYLNQQWHGDAGCLRILKNNHDLHDYVAQIKPTTGSCLIFEVTHNCWHGYLPFEGARHSIQMNYMTDKQALQSHSNKHSFSAKIKNLKKLFVKAEY
ncbi:MAG: 2OG-Fe(II) oxygenase [Legionellales bacterium]|nr:2OG-Fe(II) oxygenase [Legionellales bacterium]